MRHKKSGRKLNRTSAHRKALNRNLARSLILHGRIKTTVTKAKEMIPFASRLVTLAKDGSLASRRRAIELMGESEAVGKLFTEIAPKFADRAGGYMRIVKLPIGRLGDSAKEAFVEFIEEEAAESEEVDRKKKKQRKKLSKKAKRELAKKERKKHDLEKKRAEAAEAEAEEAKAEAEEAVEAEGTAKPEEASEPETSEETEPTQESEEPSSEPDKPDE